MDASNTFTQNPPTLKFVPFFSTETNSVNTLFQGTPTFNILVLVPWFCSACMLLKKVCMQIINTREATKEANPTPFIARVHMS